MTEEKVRKIFKILFEGRTEEERRFFSERLEAILYEERKANPPTNFDKWRDHLKPEYALMERNNALNDGTYVAVFDIPIWATEHLEKGFEPRHDGYEFDPEGDHGRRAYMKWALEKTEVRDARFE